ncbi:MAG: tetratricopeptide repeat protein [Elusimicrobia bacterium]|nr:tetratricopeptide repeat protein [Elusimicrobiota bacterium]
MRTLSRAAACAAVLAAFWAGPALAQLEAPTLSLITQRDEIARTTRDRIQKEILDRLFGPGKASAFVDVQIQLKASQQENMRFGAGAAEKNKIKAGANSSVLKTSFVLPGVPRPKNVNDKEPPAPPEAAQSQAAQQTKTDQEMIYAQNLDFKKFGVTVIHDADLAKDAAGKKKIEEARGLIVDAVKTIDPAIQPDDVVFRAADYNKPKKDWLSDLMDPKVYLPLLYALLTLLFLIFLFGPLSRFFKNYCEALVQKPAAEIHAEANITPPEDEGEGGLDETLKSQVEMLVGRKPPEPSPPPPPPPPEEEEDEEGAMGKKEPFSYINDANLKNLANLFLLRAEEPWLIAVVLSYLRPEYARQVLTSLPVELQAKVALEALKVRQVTREQIAAIDSDVKENIDYVVGGIERLIQMLEEADPRTRANILDYLQNDKPAVFDYVRKKILLFEDVARFPDREMQAVVRGLKTDVMAKALHGASPEVANKFFANMSAGAASLVKEQMEYQRDLTPAQVEEERARIMDQVKLLEKEGKIVIRGVDEAGGFHQVIASESVRGSRLSQLSGPAEAPAPAPRAEPAPAAAEDPELARRWYESGRQALDSGDLDSAVKSLRQAVELDHELADAYNALGQALYQMGRYSESIVFYENFLRLKPDPDLRAWVDSVKQSQTGTGA